LGFGISTSQGLFPEMILAARSLTIGYYGWRSGDNLEMHFANGGQLRMAPELNAGSAALQYLFAAWYPQRAEWEAALYGPDSFPTFYIRMFGNPWNHAEAGDIFPKDFQIPSMELPFLPGKPWSLTGGPHTDWGMGSPSGALDFAPTGEPVGCHISPTWATAAAEGTVERAERGTTVVRLTGDQYGDDWVILYEHIAASEQTPVGMPLHTGDHIGHPSCEGGKSTGTHFHFTRLYNGEWLPINPAYPLTLSGWQVIPGEKIYDGTLVRSDQTVIARSYGSHESLIQR
jgi:LasA protease